jgi:hypothetical protein
MREALAIHEAHQRGDLHALKRLLGDPPDFPNCPAPAGVGEIILEYAIHHSRCPSSGPCSSWAPTELPGPRRLSLADRGAVHRSRRPLRDRRAAAVVRSRRAAPRPDACCASWRRAEPRASSLRSNAGATLRRQPRSVMCAGELQPQASSLEDALIASQTAGSTLLSWRRQSERSTSRSSPCSTMSSPRCAATANPGGCALSCRCWCDCSIRWPTMSSPFPGVRPRLASQQAQPAPDLSGRAYTASSTGPAIQEDDGLILRDRGAKDHHGQMDELGFGLRPVLGDDQPATVDLSMRLSRETSRARRRSALRARASPSRIGVAGRQPRR